MYVAMCILQSVNLTIVGWTVRLLLLFAIVVRCFILLSSRDTRCFVFSLDCFWIAGLLSLPDCWYIIIVNREWL